MNTNAFKSRPLSSEPVSRLASLQEQLLHVAARQRFYRELSDDLSFQARLSASQQLIEREIHTINWYFSCRQSAPTLLLHLNNEDARLTEELSLERSRLASERAVSREPKVRARESKSGESKSKVESPVHRAWAALLASAPPELLEQIKAAMPEPSFS